MQQETRAPNLSWLLEYELRSAERYRRFVSLVLMSRTNGSTQCKKLLEGTIRGSDEVFENQENAFILMAETDLSGALTAIERYKTKCDVAVDMRFSVASYPSDARAAETLLSIGHRRLSKAKGGKCGAVVSAG